MISLALSSTSHVILESGKLDRNSLRAGSTLITSPMALRRIIKIFSGFLVSAMLFVLKPEELTSINAVSYKYSVVNGNDY
jgi:hypothetical protein